MFLIFGQQRYKIKVNKVLPHKVISILYKQIIFAVGFYFTQAFVRAFFLRTFVFIKFTPTCIEIWFQGLLLFTI